ncbi:MAG: hypothetical protein GY728_10135 [Phycisphaeraceae bacterium]|nr:hypothetical protein [Phycisphaeraceae bacterium]MCP4013456.1 hypothetical protein [Phycisphaeraceae bacterium]MCP4497402.1 hypothetical protein [Phycisphaeraceae bacterium]MCP4795177.1 hypothetical protein [Phycisphaeraceae bacterium]MCP4937640.1 hypothetical protein [Phycisphaeraceae bacterium]
MSERRSIADRIRHAFAIEDAADFEPTDREAAAAEKVCREVVRRRMTVPAVMLLEMSRPLNYLGAQALHFFQPFGTVLIEPGSWETFANFLERRGSVEYLARLIEDAEAEHAEAGKADSTASEASETVVDDGSSASGPEDDSASTDESPDQD